MAGDHDIKGLTSSSMSTPLPQSPNSFEETVVNFDQQTLTEISAIVSQLDNNEMTSQNSMIIKTEPQDDNGPSCSGGVINYGQNLFPNSDSITTADPAGRGNVYPTPQYNHYQPEYAVEMKICPTVNAGLMSSPAAGQLPADLLGSPEQNHYGSPVSENWETEDDVKPPIGWMTPETSKKKSGPGRKPKGTIPHDMKKERRKAQNRKAAKNYREKQKSRKERVEFDYTQLISEKAKGENEVKELQKEVARLTKIISDHTHSGNCCMLTSNHCTLSASQNQQGSTSTNTFPGSLVKPPVIASSVHQISMESHQVSNPHVLSFDNKTVDSPSMRANVRNTRNSVVPLPLNTTTLPVPTLHFTPNLRGTSPDNNQAAVPPYTPNSDQSFNFDNNNIYSPNPPTGMEVVGDINDIHNKISSTNVLSPFYPDMPVMPVEETTSAPPTNNISPYDLTATISFGESANIHNILFGESCEDWQSSFESLNYLS